VNSFTFSRRLPETAVFYRVFPGKLTSLIVSFRVVMILELSDESIVKIAIRQRAGRRTGRGSVSIGADTFFHSFQIG